MRQVEVLQTRDIQLQQLYNARADNYASSRTSLLTSRASAFADGGTTSWAADDDDEKLIDVQVSVDDIRSQQERILQGTTVVCIFFLSLFHYKFDCNLL